MSFANSGAGTYTFRLTAYDGINTVFDDVDDRCDRPTAVPNYGLDFDGTDDYVYVRPALRASVSTCSPSRPGSDATVSAIP